MFDWRVGEYTKHVEDDSGSYCGLVDPQDSQDFDGCRLEREGSNLTKINLQESIISERNKLPTYFDSKL